MNLTIQDAARDRRPIEGLTHTFYRYPARFSPVFARACIQSYSKPGDVVLDPYMGGGTTVIEALVLERRAIGSDINSLAVFIARVKTTPLEVSEQDSLAEWATCTVPNLNCRMEIAPDPFLHEVPRNLTLPSVRWLRKSIALCLASAQSLPTDAAQRFARCVLLNVGQWALNGRRRVPTATEFRDRVADTAQEMLAGIRELSASFHSGLETERVTLGENDAEHIAEDEELVAAGPADLVVTSPPYPGIHMLYHRWQVDGRKETDAPYWIASCVDGDGAAHYNFADRKQAAEGRYFEKAQRSFAGVRRVMRSGAVLIQMVAFSEPARQLPRYLRMLARAGFSEQRRSGQRRLWRTVPSRRWHANLKGRLPSSREVVLIHRAV